MSGSQAFQAMQWAILNRPVDITLPLRIESVANLREHWGDKSKRTKAHRMAAVAVPTHGLPCVVTLTRIAPRVLDDDNLRSAFKALRDGIADRLSVKDNDPRVEWRYAQAKGQPKEYAARVQIVHWAEDKVSRWGGA